MERKQVDRPPYVRISNTHCELEEFAAREEPESLPSNSYRRSAANVGREEAVEEGAFVNESS